MSPLTTHSTTRYTSTTYTTSKPRQSRQSSRLAVIEKYKTDVSSKWIDKTSVVNSWYQQSLVLDCKHIDPNNLPCGFTKVGPDRYQYNCTIPDRPIEKRYRPVAYKIPFLIHPDFEKGLTVSHLCHDNACYNWNHHVLESLTINKSRNGCPGGPHCHHTTKCLIPGKYSTV